MAQAQTRLLMIFDLDRTLVHGVEGDGGRVADFTAGPFSVFRRPHLRGFLLGAGTLGRIAFWSAASESYVEEVVERILPPTLEAEFIWSRGQCTVARDRERGDRFLAKDLRKVTALGHPPERTLIVDDIPRAVLCNHGNGLFLRPYEGALRDDELPALLRFLRVVERAADVRDVEKRDWRRRLERGSGGG